MPFFFRAFIGLISIFSFFSFTFSGNDVKIYHTRHLMSFSENNSDLEVYIFTDWLKPINLLEQNAEEGFSDITKMAKVIFIDISSKDMQNITKAHLGYLIGKNKNKENYFKFRKELFQLASKNAHPSEEDVKTFIQNHSDIKYEPATEENINLGLNIYERLITNLKVSKPTLIAYNLHTRQMKRIDDFEKISKQKILSEVESLKTQSSSSKS